jgi:hypothetical protein
MHTDRVTQLLQTFRWVVLGRPSHSHDLALRHYNLFGKFPEHIAGKKFDDVCEAKHKLLRWINEQAADFSDSAIKKLVTTHKKRTEKRDGCVQKLINECSKGILNHYQNKML